MNSAFWLVDVSNLTSIIKRLMNIITYIYNNTLIFYNNHLFIIEFIIVITIMMYKVMRKLDSCILYYFLMLIFYTIGYESVWSS